ncbi:MAG: hypothetical protein AAFY71_12595 [Bacteroidota bacterium]
MKVKFLIVALAFFGFGMSAFAQTATPKVTGRQIHQTKRIKQGVRSGELTKKETVRLSAQQARIHATKRRAKADGVVTPAERATIRRKQKRANKNIYIQKNDRQNRW